MNSPGNCTRCWWMSPTVGLYTRGKVSCKKRSTKEVFPTAPAPMKTNRNCVDVFIVESLSVSVLQTKVRLLVQPLKDGAFIGKVVLLFCFCFYFGSISIFLKLSRPRRKQPKLASNFLLVSKHKVTTLLRLVLRSVWNCFV